MSRAKTLKYFLFINLVSFTFVICGTYAALAQTEDLESEVEKIAPLYGLGANFGTTYDPTSNITFLQLNAFALYDYDEIWPHPAPDTLRFKVECNLGITTSSPHRAITSANMLALRYIEKLSSDKLRPYVEAGIGIIYTDFQVNGQGMRFNFNPQLGIGTEILVDSKPAYYAAIRAHHLSNAEIDDSNRGINSVTFVIGKLF